MLGCSWESRWGRAEREVWRLVSGLPDQKARGRHLLAMQLFVDDSGKEDHSPVMVLAGYMSSAERWAAFSNEWQGVIDREGLQAFKMSSAWRLGAEYQDMGPVRRNALLVELTAIIHRNVEAAFVNVMPFDGFKKYMRLSEDRSSPVSRIYIGLFFSMLTRASKNAYHNWCDEPLDIIFDEQGGEPQGWILDAMKYFRPYAEEHYPGLRVTPPLFRKDEEFLPLQAADLLAWLVRREAVSRAKGVETEQLPERTLLNVALDMPSDIHIWDEDRMKRGNLGMFKRLMKEEET